MGSDKGGENELNPDSLKLLKNRIYLMEKENHKTKKYKDCDMVDRIRKLIEMEVDKGEK